MACRSNIERRSGSCARARRTSRSTMLSSRVLLTSFLLAPSWLPMAFAQAPVQPKQFRVHVKVSADADLRVVVQKGLEEELRAVPNVVVSDAAPDYTISVIVLKVVTRSQKDVGATFSVLVSENYAERVKQFAESHVASEFREQLTIMLSGAVKPAAHWVETASGADVRKVCRSIVLSFDADVLTARRKAAAGPLR